MAKDRRTRRSNQISPGRTGARTTVRSGVRSGQQYRKAQKPSLRRKSLNWTLFTLALTTLLLIGNVAVRYFQRNLQLTFGEKSYAVTGGTGSIYYASSYENKEELAAAGDELCKEIEASGAVLLRNEGDLLPLAGESSVSLWNGSADLKAALEEEGIRVKTFKKSVDSGFEEYNDAALVVLTRKSDGTEDFSYDREAGTHALQITETERALLANVCGKFENVIVLLASDNPMELGFLEEFQIKACLWTGDYGENGEKKFASRSKNCAKAVAEVLSGRVNPSGRLADTYVYNNLHSPAAQNMGNCEIVNSPVKNGDRYLVYAEGMYVGYRYYETRYEDVVTGATDAASYKYASEVIYPFGYGLSYTAYEWSDFAVKIKNGVYTVTTTVTNTGSKAGRDVVEIYLQKPYTDYDREQGIEKPSVELVGYEKTQLLNPGESETVSVKITQDQLKTYAAASDKTYILEAGAYYLTAGKDAHAAINNILNFKGLAISSEMVGDGDRKLVFPFAVEENDVTTYASSSQTGIAVNNRFSEADIRGIDTEFRYLTRADWNGTWPSLHKNGEWKIHSKFIEQVQVSSSDSGNASAPVYNSPHGEENLRLAQLRTAKTGDYRWENLLDQLSWKETYELVSKGGGVTNEILSVGAPNAQERGDAFGLEGGHRYPGATMLASTWDTKLMEKLGELIGEDALQLETNIWFAPSLDLHRTAFGGKNAQSFSEDTILTGTMASALYGGAKSKGLIPVAGNFALETQVTNREGVLVYSNEQTIRELYLKSFEKLVTDGNVSAVRAGMNRTGARWCGGHKGLIAEVLRGEWGFEGMVMTDDVTRGKLEYCDLLEGLEAGTDLWMNTSDSMFRLSGAQLTYSVRERFRKAAGRILMTVARSNAMNGIGEDSILVYHKPLWRKVKDVVNAILALLILFSLWTSFRGWRAVFIRSRKIALERRHRKDQRRRELRKREEYEEVE